MRKRKQATDDGMEVQAMTLHLGGEVREQLERCRELMGDRAPDGERPSRGLVCRLGIRRLLLSLLGERADFTQPDCPLVTEYLSHLDYEAEVGELPDAERERDNAADHKPGKGKAKGKGKGKGKEA